MKKSLLAAMIAMGVLSAAQAKDIPAVCEKMFEMMRDKAEQVNNQEAIQNLDEDKIRREWDSMSEDQQNGLAADCEAIIELMEQDESMQ